MESTAIEVHATPTAAQIAAGLRQAVTVVGTLAGALGYAKVFNEHIDVILSAVGPISAIAAILWGQFATRTAAQNLAVTAAAAPDHVAVVR